MQRCSITSLIWLKRGASACAWAAALACSGVVAARTYAANVSLHGNELEFGDAFLPDLRPCDGFVKIDYRIFVACPLGQQEIHYLPCFLFTKPYPVNKGARGILPARSQQFHNAFDAYLVELVDLAHHIFCRNSFNVLQGDLRKSAFDCLSKVWINRETPIV